MNMILCSSKISKTDALKVPSTAKVLLLKKIFFALHQFKYAVSSIKPPSQSLISPLPVISPPPPFLGKKVIKSPPPPSLPLIILH